MTDNSLPTELIKESDGTVAVYQKRHFATGPHTCDGCAAGIPAGSYYYRVQYAKQEAGENLRSRKQARAVDYRRRVVLRFHPDCLPSQGLET